MDVKCGRCGFEYELEEHRVPAEGATVKCTHCNHLFRVRKKTVLLTEALPKRPSTNPSQPVLSKSAGLDPVPTAGKQSAASVDLDGFPESSFVHQPGMKSGPDSWGIETGTPTGAEPVSTWRKSRGRTWLFVLILLIFSAGGFVWYVQYPELLQSLVEMLPGKEKEVTATMLKATRKAYEKYLMDSNEQLASAESELRSMLNGTNQDVPEALELLAQIGIVQAEKCKERIRQIDELLKEPAIPKDVTIQMESEEERRESPALSLQKERKSLMEIAGRAMQAARANIMKVEKQDPQSYLSHRARANYLRVSESKRFEILAEIKAAASMKPNDPELLFIEGAWLAEDPVTYPQAVVLLEKVIDLEPNRLQARYRLAHVLSKTQRVESAKMQLQDILTINPSHEQARTFLTHLSKPKESEPPKPQAASTPPPEVKKAPPKKTYDNWMRIADGYLQRGNPEQAIEAYDAALELRAEDVEALSGKGLGYLDLGENMLAIEWFRRALDKSPRFAVAIMGIAEAYKYMGDRQSALVYYQKYLEVNPGGEEAQIAKRNIEKLK